MRKSRAIWYLKQQEHDRLYKEELLGYLQSLDSAEDSGNLKNSGTVGEISEIFAVEEKLKVSGSKYGLAPDSICCPITLEPMLQPTITPDGISYDLNSLTSLVQRGVYTDPTTRNKFKPDQLVLNENLT